MMIDEAISHALEVAEQEESIINYPHSDIVLGDLDIESRKHFVAEQKQIAAWLTELKEAKQLLKMVVEDISKMPCNNDTHSPDSCYICVKHGNCSYTDSFKWCKADIALKLIGETNDEP